MGDWGSSENAPNNVETSSTITSIDQPKTTKKEEEDEEKESYLPKWAKNAYSTHKIIGNVERCVKTRCQIQETLNYICFTFTILPQNAKESLQDIH